MSMIKRIVDLLRSTDGYAGIAIYRGQGLLFCEGWEPSHIARVVEFYSGPASHFQAKRMTLVIQGFTITVFMAGDMLVVCRSAGRFTSIPSLPEEEPDYTAGQAPAGLISREEARKEAEAMLKVLMKHG
ncbi:hypothetical protein [Methanocella sp.]|uniref:hypothetical protein n=1 Tax=Methanocella sp. TaxID=2052833 RepID=UPI002D7E537D|nr:hypothetical protein [Methanocella sp.]